MAGLLVSVRTLREAWAALRGGADVIDVKEPRRGSLGAASPSRLRAISRQLVGRVPLSAALGELLPRREGICGETLAGYAFAKLGLAGCRCCRDWPELWRSQLAALPSPARPVAVSYADWRRAAAPPPEELVERAAQLPCAAVLFDTYDKRGGDLFAHLAPEDLLRLIAKIRRAGLLVVLAGSLRGEAIPIALELGPDLIAVRGAVCRGGRRGVLDEALVRELAARLGDSGQRIAAVPWPVA